LASTEEIAISFFKNIIRQDPECPFNYQELLEKEVTVDEFMSLFRKEDVYSYKILNVINTEIRNQR
jgi:hypothetical protein